MTGLSLASTLSSVTLILGGVRSGKSRHGMRLAEAAAPQRLCLATAQALDAEMQARIADHKAQRGPGWRTVEEPLELPRALAAEHRVSEPVLVDCLTLWLANLLAAGRDAAAETAQLVRTLASVSAPVILVSGEVGLGIVPGTAAGRAFRDHAGRLNQAVAEAAQSVVFMVAGLPLVLKAPVPPEGDGA